MESKEARLKIIEIFGERIMFNKDFDKNLSKLKDGMIQDIIEWCKNCKDNKELGSVPPKREFKNLYVFFRKIASDVRVTLIKEQNKYFIQINLEDHKGYDNTRVRLGYKKSSYN